MENDEADIYLFFQSAQVCAEVIWIVNVLKYSKN